MKRRRVHETRYVLCVRNPVDYTEQQVVNQQIELMIQTESLGYDSVWAAEHHFSEHGYCASPQALLAAI
ncbi:MAG: LLM class flavin-dependent oxidoreductase [Candidatus Reddybacter sp.]